VDVLSGGRLLVGAAIGWLEGEFEALGVPFKERVSRSEEALELFRTLWTQEHPKIETRRHRLHDVTVSPMPLQKPRPPIYIGGGSEGALRRVARFGDGWHATSSTVEQFRQGVEAVRRFWTEAGRAGTPAVSLRIPIMIEGVHRTAVDLGFLRGRHVIGGPVATILDELRGFRDAGCEHIALEVSYATYPTILDTIDVIADRLRPHVVAS
jgi:alkanesulfonate monooxygenase SsuD/methylene tetrahydromethanopterin reductase-like flavin-dependent oxidoreductase (luciferase family)